MSKLKQIIAISGMSALLITSAAVSANTDSVEARITAMANIGFGASQLVPMIKGKADFDYTAAKLALRMTQSSALAFEGKFPEGSNSKGANPAIWENKADFDKKLAEFVLNANMAVKADPKDLESLQVAYGKLLKNCADCHQSYRIK